MSEWDDTHAGSRSTRECQQGKYQGEEVTHMLVAEQHSARVSRVHFGDKMR